MEPITLSQYRWLLFAVFGNRRHLGAEGTDPLYVKMIIEILLLHLIILVISCMGIVVASATKMAACKDSLANGYLTLAWQLAAF